MPIKHNKPNGKRPIKVTGDNRNCLTDAGSDARYITLDSSQYQGTIDWGTVINSQPTGESLDQIFIRATIGERKIDSNFAINTQALDKLYQSHGAYHDLVMGEDCGAQAIMFDKNVSTDTYIESYMLDVELPSGVSSWPGMTECVLEFLGNFSSEVDYIYTNADTWNNNFNTSSCSDVTDSDLWVAEYGAATSPGPINCWKDDWALWQYTNKGSWPGVTGPIDVSCENPGSRRNLKHEKPLSGLADDNLQLVQIPGAGSAADSDFAVDLDPARFLGATSGAASNFNPLLLLGVMAFGLANHWSRKERGPCLRRHKSANDVIMLGKKLARNSIFSLEMEQGNRAQQMTC